MRSTKRVFAFAIVIVVLGVSFFLPSPSRPSVPNVHATSRTIMLTGSLGTGWNGTNPGPTIIVTRGDTISITLVSGDSNPHTFIVDVDRDGVIYNPNCTMDKCSNQFPPTTTFPFTADMPTGDYTYYCSIHLQSMVGTFRVLAPATPDLSISSNPSPIAFLQGSSGTSMITLTSVNGFAGTVSLTATVSPVSSIGPSPSASFMPASVPIPSGGSGTSTLTVSTTASTLSGTYSVMVNGTSGSILHTTTVTVQVNAPPGEDFTITSNPASLNVTQGSSSSSTITLTSVNGFSGILVLSKTISSSGPSVTLSPTSVSLPASSSVTSTVTASAVAGAYSSVATGNYFINITATNGSLSHTKTVAVTVNSATSPPSGIGSLPVLALVVAAIVIIGAVAVVVYLIKRKPVAS